MEHMREKIDHNRTIYLHCWGGVGRTGTIVACWFVYHGYTFEEALGHLNNLWKECPKSTRRTHCPEYKHQEDFVKHFDNYLHTL